MQQPQAVSGSEAIISEANVRAALDSMIYSTVARRTSPLDQLWLVAAFLSAPEQPASPHNQRYALQTILVDLITAELTRHRAVVGLPTLVPDAPLETVIEQIARDAGDGNIERIGWSWLYHRYVRVDLNLSARDFCKYAHLDARTRQRYQNHAIRRLTERLIETEREARHRLHKRRLYAALPSSIPVRSFGREQALRDLNRQCRTAQIVQISGAEGIGKTALVQEYLRGLIDAGELADIIWIDRPAGVQAIRERLAEVPPNSFGTARDYFAEYPTAVIIDDLTALIGDQAALDALLRELAGAQVYLIHDQPLPQVVAQVALTPLSLAETTGLIRHLKAMQVQTTALSGSEIAAIWTASGGIPGVIRSELQHLIADDPR